MIFSSSKILCFGSIFSGSWHLVRISHCYADCVFSKVYNDYVFKEPAIPSNVSYKIDVLVNDELELQLFQVSNISSMPAADLSEHVF